MTRTVILALEVCAFAGTCFGQSVSALEKLRALKLPSRDGSTTVIYSPAAQIRAERYQAALESAHVWFTMQLKIRFPLTLAVLEKKDWEGVSLVPYPMPNSKNGLVTLPARIEDFPGFTEMRTDADILAEGIAFHELGHILAAKESIGSGNPWVNELVACIFAQEYIWSHQPELKDYISPGVPESLSPRFTSLADLDYLYEGVSFSNYAWFQFQLIRLASFVAQTRDLTQVVAELRMAFPAEKRDSLRLPEAIRRMEAVAPGFTEVLGPLAKPATIARVHEETCKDRPAGEPSSTLLIFDNRTSEEKLVMQTGNAPTHIAAGRWHRFRVKPGEELKLSNGNCLIALNEPALAVIE
jgi:hypothetical protein